MSDRTKRVLWTFAIIYFAIAVVGRFAPHDNTDPPGGRSGLGLYIDALTGCEYLSAGLFGGITPRLDRSGKHVCGAPK